MGALLARGRRNVACASSFERPPSASGFHADCGTADCAAVGSCFLAAAEAGDRPTVANYV
eukprot:3986764-Pyramimonas_sp.AAC.1